MKAIIKARITDPKHLSKPIIRASIVMTLESKDLEALRKAVQGIEDWTDYSFKSVAFVRGEYESVKEHEYALESKQCPRCRSKLEAWSTPHDHGHRCPNKKCNEENGLFMIDLEETKNGNSY